MSLTAPSPKPPASCFRDESYRGERRLRYGQAPYTARMCQEGSLWFSFCCCPSD